MEALEVFLKGVCAGALVSVPFGPLAFWAVHMRLLHGRSALLLISFGASLGNLVIAYAVVFSAGYFQTYLEGWWKYVYANKYLIGLIFCLLGIFVVFSQRKAARVKVLVGGTRMNISRPILLFVIPLVLTVIQPANIASIIGLFTFFHVTQQVEYHTLLLSGFYPATFFGWIIGVTFLAHIGEKAGKVHFRKFSLFAAWIFILVGVGMVFRSIY